MAEGTLGGTKISGLPRSSFAYCEPDGPCHFPIRDKNGKADAAHVRNALARLSQSPFEAKARPKVEAAAKELGIGEGKALGELKAEPMTTSQLDRWLKGSIPRRVLVLPYGGPIPRAGAPLGVDIDDEWFDDDTDTVDGHAALKASNRRLVDFHHDLDPTGVMKGAILGHVAIDDTADTATVDGEEYTGRWGDFWANAGEKRRQLVAYLERRSVPLYGSSQAAYKKATRGHIDTWPLIRHTITTSPQNTYAVVPAIKALLTAPTLDEIPADALKALLVGLDTDTQELLLNSPAAAVQASALVGDGVAKAGRVLSLKTIARLREAMDILDGLVASGKVTLKEPDPEEETSG
jgi:hypothetical protein